VKGEEEIEPKWILDPDSVLISLTGLTSRVTNSYRHPEKFTVTTI
jgi:hypothetical protein